MHNGFLDEPTMQVEEVCVHARETHTNCELTEGRGWYITEKIRSTSDVRKPVKHSSDVAITSQDLQEGRGQSD